MPLPIPEPRRRRRRHSKLHHVIRRRWTDLVVGVVFVVACLVALLLIMDVIDTVRQ
ncbi:MAG TPA: hypothetical protein VMT93_00665 [Gemmatimonadaceae bacterium]|nr:hypothetical protein [Gemmatimonadaceae bacterium]